MIKMMLLFIIYLVLVLVSKRLPATFLLDRSAESFLYISFYGFMVSIYLINAQI
ncbi:hypothetical protein C8N37_106459 [Sphingobacterium faecium]|nr:hypothetical protein C8N37_106459 [Sphingobacterium faecium]